MVTSPGDIQPMITAQPAGPDNNAASNTTVSNAANSESQKKPIPMVSIPAIISIGLVIATVYLVSRIVTGHRPIAAVKHAAIATTVKPPSAAAPVAPAVQASADIPVSKAAAVIKTETKPAKPLVLPEKQPEKQPEKRPEKQPAKQPAEVSKAVAAEDAIPMITPKTGERFIQIGALDEEATRRFVKKLRNEKIEPHVAPASKPELLRILIGPFENRDALNAEKAQLELEGMETFVRQY
jgi:SPOR domain